MNRKMTALAFAGFPSAPASRLGVAGTSLAPRIWPRSTVMISPRVNGLREPEADLVDRHGVEYRMGPADIVQADVRILRQNFL